MHRTARRRIAGSDAGFLYIESPSQTSTCTHVVILGAPGENQERLTREALVDHLVQRLPRVPAMTRRLQHVPGRIGHALLVDDDRFDVEDHVRHDALPLPGGDAEYDAWIADRLALHLDTSRPLWQVTLLDGLAGGRQALVFAFHHTLADGAGLLGILAELLDDRAATRPPWADADELAPHPPMRPTALFLATLTRQVVVWLTMPWLLLVTIRRFRRVRRVREAAAVAVPNAGGSAPRSVLNTSTDDRRAFARATLPLAELRAVRRAAGTPLSDVVLAVVAGGLRSHLAERGELPDEPLVVNVPIGHDAPGATPRVSGNVFCNFYAMLPTHVADPCARLEATAAATAEAKRQLDVQGRDTLITWLDRIPPALGAWGARTMAEQRLTGEAAPDFNLIVSNLKVPDDGWTMHGRRVEQVIFSGPVADGAGLNLTVVGYGDQVVVGIQTNPSAVADPVDLASRLHAALVELADAYDHAPTDQGQVA
ncbi:wax ester/triacylglycerol synthase family O-acyltransferase [Nocardioides jishulii]|nr:wax ester/triacylglycerol synthase family O-acyltransferase [Nocardioides jishulii]